MRENRILLLKNSAETHCRKAQKMLRKLLIRKDKAPQRLGVLMVCMGNICHCAQKRASVAVVDVGKFLPTWARFWHSRRHARLALHR
jgi:hypothetical protein